MVKNNDGGLYLLAPPSNTTNPPVHNPAPPCGIPQTYLSDPAGVWLTSALQASQHGPGPWKISKMSAQVLALHLWSSISSSSSCEERRLPLYLLSVKGTKVSVSSPSSLFSLNTILLSCVAVSTGPEDANENTSGFLVGAGWSSTSQSKVTNSQLADFVVQAPLTHSSSASNPLSSSHEDLSASVYWEI
ncbi:hypothetical protein IGI04_029424 [Brassica rapa subsp. trilocularis]|uniref:Uncharacterized protein n=1 Tax=Brassica rapa subsp. trilocularis TaxID=1813537 RepID=A0ABQ7LQN6_BRACM|nr:hypothetical protein IGI04_029424 [Brassica rapa subsp. trilocularis]